MKRTRRAYDCDIEPIERRAERVARHERREDDFRILKLLPRPALLPVFKRLFPLIHAVNQAMPFATDEERGAAVFDSGLASILQRDLQEIMAGYPEETRRFRDAAVAAKWGE